MQAPTIATRFVTAVLTICAAKDITVKDICQDLPFSAAYINQLKHKPETSVGANFIVALYRKYRVNPVWVLLGEGDMIGSPEAANMAKDLKSILAGVEKMREIQSEVIEKMIGEMLKWEITPTEVKAKLIGEVKKRNKSN